MICSKCGHDNSGKAHTADAWCMYQVRDGKVVNDMFLPDRIPEGWYDSPKAAKAAIEDPVNDSDKKIDGRSKEARQLKAQADGDSSGTD